MNLALTIVMALLTLVNGFLILYVRSYTSSYASKKGENLATHEDMQKLVEQVKAVTETTSRIESQISQESWERQQRWEYKQRNLVDVVSYLHDLEKQLTLLYSTHKAAKAGNYTDATWNRPKVDANAAWQTALANFERATDLCLLNCSEETKRSIGAVRGNSKDIAAGITNGDPDQYMSKYMNLSEPIQRLRVAVRQEMDAPS